MAVNLEGRLEELKRQLSVFPDPKEPPPTMLDVIGRSNRERDWQRLLFHYLSPDAAHGLNHELLEHLLIALSDRADVGYTFSQFDLNEIQIDQEVSTPQGRPDAVIWSPQNWFICWELKVRSAEGTGQTRGYVDADSFSGIDIEKNGDQTESHYLYLAPEDAKSPEANEFIHISWKWMRTVLQSFLTESHGEHPSRTVAQLREFVETIQTELVMTDYQENQRDKAKLYMEYRDEIIELERAFEDQWGEFADRWGAQLAQTLNTAKMVDDPDVPDRFVVVDTIASNADSQRWLFRQGSDWALLRRKDRWRSTTDLSTIYSAPEDEPTAAICLFHRLDQNRDLAVDERTLELQFWHKNENSDAFKTAYNRYLMDNEAEIREKAPSAVRFPDVTDTKGKLWRARYDINPERYDDFFEAYVGALNDAFSDLVIDHPSFLANFDEAFDEAIQMYR